GWTTRARVRIRERVYQGVISGALWRMIRAARPGATSVPAEGLLQPPRAVPGRDLGVDEQRPLAGAGQPVGYGRQVRRVAPGHPLEPEPAADRGDVGRREPDDIEGIAVRPEVVHLRAVRTVVVDDPHH